MTPLEDELASREYPPMTVAALNAAFLAVGYHLDRSMDCRSISRWMSGPRAGKSYPCVTTGMNEADTGRRAYQSGSRRDARYHEMQEMRRSGRYYAVTRGALLEP